MDEYLTGQTAGMKQQEEARRKKRAAYAHEAVDLVVVKIEGLGQNTYVGLLPMPTAAHVSLSIGDFLKVTFIDPASRLLPLNGRSLPAPTQEAIQAARDTEVITPEIQAYLRRQAEVEYGNFTEWHAEVSTPHAICPPHMITVWLSRPYNESKGRYGDCRELDVIALDSHDIVAAHKLIASSQGHKVVVEVVSDDRRYMQNIKAANKLKHGSLGACIDFNGWNRLSLRIAVGKDLRSLPISDIFADIRDEFQQPEGLMDIQGKQQAAVINSQRALGMRQLIQGPPGTGKTYLSTQILIPFMLSEKKHLVLGFAPTNSAADDLALSAAHLLQKLKQGHPSGKTASDDKYVIRLYSKAAEDQIKSAEFKKLAPRIISRPNMQELVEQDTDNISHQLREQFDADQRREFQFVSDERVKLLTLSAGYRMLSLAGIIADPDTPQEEIDGRRTANVEFVTLYEQNVNGQLCEEQKKQLRDFTAELYKQVLRNATFISCSTMVAGNSFLHEAIADKVSVLLHDDATKDPSVDMLPIYAAPFTNIKGYIAFFDRMQLRPVAPESAKENTFKLAMGTSDIARLIDQGFPYERLTEQHRMTDDIEEQANFLAYNSNLVGALSTCVQNRPLAQNFRRMGATKYKLPRNIVFLNIKNRVPSKTTVSASGSRSNEYFAATSISMAEDLLKLDPDNRATVGVLTGYRNQEVLLQRAKCRMILDPELRGLNVQDRLQIGTVDWSQGKEFNFVVLDILLIKGNPGFFKDPGRLNVATTRARDGMIVLSTWENISELNDPKNPVKKLLKYLKRFRRDVDPGADGRQYEHGRNL